VASDCPPRACERALIEGPSAFIPQATLVPRVFQGGCAYEEPLSFGMLLQSLPRVKAMSNKSVTDVGAEKFKVPASKKKKTVKTAKLKSSKWYQSAVRSIGIVKAKASESRDDVFE
jgi:hypothetical protein